MKWYHVFGICLGISVLSLLLAWGLYFFGPQPEQKPTPPLIPPVEYYLAEKGSHALEVRSQGLVSAGRETTLIPEVSGPVVWVDSRFRAGGYFEEGEVFARVDAVPYQSALAEADLRLAAARLVLAQEKAAAEQAAADWAELGRAAPGELALRIPQLQRAEAEIVAAEKAVSLARRNLERTELKVPFDGRVRERMVDLGSVVMANTTPVASYFGVETAEVRLPLNLRDTGLIALPEPFSGVDSTEGLPKVTLSAETGGTRQEWTGHIRRVEGTIDPRTRLLYAVAEVDDPYGRNGYSRENPPLKVGLFVEALIEGRLLEDVFVLPREVMLDRETLYVIDADNRMHRRQVTVVHADARRVIISQGLQPGDRVNRTPIEFFIEAMRVAPQTVQAE